MREPRSCSFVLSLLTGFALVLTLVLFIAVIPVVRDPSVPWPEPCSFGESSPRKTNWLKKWMWERDLRLLVETVELENRKQKAWMENHGRVCAEPTTLPGPTRIDGR